MVERPVLSMDIWGWIFAEVELGGLGGWGWGGVRGWGVGEVGLVKIKRRAFKRSPFFPPPHLL